jgi:hypothetical protein
MPRPPIPVRAGERYGRLVVLADRVGKARTVPVRCDCGVEKDVVVWELLRRENALRSCGCARREAAANLRPGASMPGARNPAAKLTAAKVRWARRRLARGESRRSVADRYGIGLSQVARIECGESWGSVP